MNKQKDRVMATTTPPLLIRDTTFQSAIESIPRQDQARPIIKEGMNSYCVSILIAARQQHKE
jgi:hypothetical protein